MPTIDWIGKKAVINHHNEVPFHLLKEVPGLSVGEPGSGNLLIEGDNLLATKAAEENNAENLLVIHDKKLASAYTKNWQEHEKHSEAYRGRGQ